MSLVSPVATRPLTAIDSATGRFVWSFDADAPCTQLKLAGDAVVADCRDVYVLAAANATAVLLHVAFSTALVDRVLSKMDGASSSSAGDAICR